MTDGDAAPGTPQPDDPTADDISDHDRTLMRALAGAIDLPGRDRELDDDLVARCEGLLSWIDIDSDLAILLEEAAGELAGTRGGDTTTAGLEFTFDDDACVLDVQIENDTLRGQVIGADATGAVLRSVSGAEITVDVDELGTFVIASPPAGSARIELTLDTGRRIRTDWFTV